jgi:all-trans-retinol 13,14-reductase
MPDVIVVGAGLGGLFAAAMLAGRGRRVLVLEKNGHVGGTSYVFRRGPFLFPQGPLSFGYPEHVDALMEKAGFRPDWTYRRNHFQLISPEIDIVFSRPLIELRDDLKIRFPGESAGLDAFFGELMALISRLDDDPSAIRPFALLPSAERLAAHLASRPLVHLLGSQGSEPPDMSMLNLAIMWRIMSQAGIWFPSCGIHGLAERLADAVRGGGGKIRLMTEAAEILVEQGRAAKVRTVSGETFAAPWIVAAVDYKKTFLDLLAPDAVPREHLDAVRSVPYTGSELCVYLGLERNRVDWSRMRAEHLFFRESFGRPEQTADPDRFEEREIEICRWSENWPAAAPPGKAVLILRAGYPYERAAPWRSGEKARRAGYRDFKAGRVRRMLAAVESVLPGLSSAIEVIEAATPLTYRDWGGRTLGSIAGWAWTPGAAAKFREPYLVRTPIAGLLTAGLYAATGLFRGGVPTALSTAEIAAETILAAEA